MNYDNPAARLLALLEEGKKKPKETSCRVVWEELLATRKNPPLLMSRLGKAMELPSLIIEAVKEQFPNQGNTWHHWESQVNTGFMVQNLQSDWASFINHIDNHSITYLRMTADLLASKSTTKLIADESLVEIKTKLTEILEEILKSNQPDEVKKYLARNIRRMITAIEEYHLTGAILLLDSIDTTVGHMAIDQGYKNFLVNTDLGKRLLEVLSSMANVVTVAVGIPQITIAIAQLSK